MDAARFKQVAELFEALRGERPDTRRSRLEHVEPSVRRDVEALLAEHASAESGSVDPLLAAGESLRRGMGSTAAAIDVNVERDSDIPNRVGRFPILDEIARGGIGIVLRAEDLSIGRDVAVKVLRPEFAEDDEMARRLRYEGRIGGSLQHPGIVPIHEVGTTDEGVPFLVMRVVEGRTLAAILTEAVERTELEEQRHALLTVFEKVSHAIGYAHARGVVHRDLKPANLMVGEFGEVQVMDWGLAKELKDRTQDSALGTPAYMAPEQACGDHRVPSSARLDVFGLGGILCELLTGVPPFDGESTGTALEQVRRAELDPALARVGRCGAVARRLDTRAHTSVRRDHGPLHVHGVPAGVGVSCAELQGAIRSTGCDAHRL